MTRPDCEAHEVLDAVRALPEGALDRVERVSRLTAGEITDIRAGCRAGPDWLRALAARLTEEWEVMEASERIAAMLTIALALREHES